MTRNLAETSNLLFLFFIKPELLTKWKISDSKTRKNEFSPVKVRIKIEDSGVPLPIDQDRYSGLCDVGVHLNPNTTPQAHNPIGRPTLGSVPQEHGLVAALNELAGATAISAVGLVNLLDLGDREQKLKSAIIKLLRSVGSYDLAKLKSLRAI